MVLGAPDHQTSSLAPPTGALTAKGRKSTVSVEDPIENGNSHNYWARTPNSCVTAQ
jgi:hypothetical protein